MSRLQMNLSVLTLFLLFVGLSAEEKKDSTKPKPTEVVEKGKTQVGYHSLKLEAGKLYHIRVEGSGFTPNVLLRPGQFSTQAKTEEDSFQAYFLPTESRTYRLLIMPNLFDDIDGGELEYKMTLKPIPIAAKPVLEEKGQLQTSDPMYKNQDRFTNAGPHKAYKVKLKARQLCIIEMKRTGKDRKDLDPMLFLEDANGKIVASDDDSGGNANARIIFTPRRAGEYNVIATTADKENVGPFTLTARTAEE